MPVALFENDATSDNERVAIYTDGEGWDEGGDRFRYTESYPRRLSETLLMEMFDDARLFAAQYRSVGDIPPTYGATAETAQDAAQDATQDARTDMDGEFSPPEVVSADGTKGVALEKFTEAFEWPPTEAGDTTTDTREVAASSDTPYYIVRTVDGELDIYTADDLTSASFEQEPPDADELDAVDMARVYGRILTTDFINNYPVFQAALTDLIRAPGDDPEVGFAGMPDGWDQTSVLQAWLSLGGSWTSAYNHFHSAGMSPGKARRMASAYKDQVWGTELWRSL